MASAHDYNLGDDSRLTVLIDALARIEGSLAPPVGAQARARGLVVLALRWTAENAPSGDLSIFDPSLLARAVEWEQDPKDLVAVLQETGFLDARQRWIDLDEMYTAYKPFIGWALEE